MKLSLVQKKVEKATADYRAKRKNDARRYKGQLKKNLKLPYDDRCNNNDWIERAIIEAEQDARTGSLFTKSYKKTMGKWNGKNWELDLVNETGHSYRWWSMFKRIKGQLVLNTYRYSNQTANHIYHAKQVLDTLGIKYLSIEAPRGLDDLGIASSHAACKTAEAIITNKFARKPHKHLTAHAKALVKNLSKLGVSVSEADIDFAILATEKQRANKLERLRNKIRFVKANDADANKTGLHVYHSGYVSWTMEKDWETAAKEKGFKKVYIHEAPENVVSLKGF